jgi:hypothetical protein
MQVRSCWVVGLLAAVACGSRKERREEPRSEPPPPDASFAPDAEELGVDGWRRVRWDMGTAEVRDALTRDGIASSFERVEKDPVGPNGEVMHVVEDHVRFEWDGAEVDAWLLGDRLLSITFIHGGLTEAEAEQRFAEAIRRFGPPLGTQGRELGFWLHGTSTIDVVIFPYPGNHEYMETWKPYGAPR